MSVSRVFMAIKRRWGVPARPFFFGFRDRRIKRRIKCRIKRRIKRRKKNSSFLKYHKKIGAFGVFAPLVCDKLYPSLDFFSPENTSHKFKTFGW